MTTQDDIFRIMAKDISSQALLDEILNRLCRLEGVKVKHVGGNGKRKKPFRKRRFHSLKRFTKEEKKFIMEHHKKGMNFHEIASNLKRKTSSIYSFLKNQGIEPHRPGE